MHLISTLAHTFTLLVSITRNYVMGLYYMYAYYSAVGEAIQYFIDRKPYDREFMHSQEFKDKLNELASKAGIN